ncbi:hypothetical protein LLE94_09630, partial [Haemophilus influenzae]
IYNDFDGYAERLAYINDTNALRTQIFAKIGNATPKNKRLPKSLKAEIIKIIDQFKGYKDLNCLTSWLLFSGQQVSSLDELYKKD